MKNLVASIQGRLKQVAEHEQKAYQLILLRYFQERFLYRMAVSAYKSNFCLKGGAFLYAYEQEKSRPTMDIDFLALQIKNEQLKMESIFKQICQVTCEEDGIIFDIDTLKGSEIAKEGKYNGIRIKVQGHLGNIKQNMQIDIGFGDIITPRPVEMDYPTLLEMAVPKVNAYSVESVIAEKFEAMIDLGEMNSRMKDFYDVFKLLDRHAYVPEILKEAIGKTFENRQTICQPSHPIFSSDFARNEKRQIQWKAFLEKSKLDTTLQFDSIMDSLSIVLLPIYQFLVQRRKATQNDNTSNSNT